MLVILQSSIFESSNHSWSSAIENSPITLSAFFYRDFRYLEIIVILTVSIFAYQTDILNSFSSQYIYIYIFKDVLFLNATVSDLSTNIR